MEMSQLKHWLVMFALKSDCYVVPMCFKKKPIIFRYNTLLIGEPFKFSEYEEFKDVKTTHEILDRACEVLTEKMSYLKEVSPKLYKKEIKQKQKSEL